MNDFELLLVLLAVFYCWECIYWIRRPGIAFRTWFGLGWNIQIPNGGLSNRFGGFLFTTVLPSVGGLFPSYWSPFIVTENSVIRHPDPLDLYNEAPTATGESIPFDQIKRVTAKRHHILINGQKFAKAGSASLAQCFAHQIRILRDMEPSKRAGSLRSFVTETLDAEAIDESMNSLNRSTKLLGFLSLMLFFHVGFVVPWIGLNFTLSSTWTWLVGVLVIINTAIAVLFCRLHGRFFPAAKDERFQHTFMMALYPLASIRAKETLMRPLLERHHPLAIAKVVLGREEFERWASRHLRRMNVRAQTPGDRDGSSYFTMLSGVSREFLRRENIDVEKLLAPTKASDSSCRSYCPRCGSQFTFESGSCADCGSIPVEALSQS